MDKSEQELMIQERIACDEAGYPLCEARFVDIKEWEEFYQMDWDFYKRNAI